MRHPCRGFRTWGLRIRGFPKLRVPHWGPYSKAILLSGGGGGGLLRGRIFSETLILGLGFQPKAYLEVHGTY